MSEEWIMIACMANGGILFAAGGTDIPKIGGQKWLRRFVMPFIFAALAFSAGIIWWRCLGLFLAMVASMHLGYGEKYPYWAKFLVGITFFLPTLFLGFTIWQIITPVIFIGMFWLSNQKFSSNAFVWKVCEFLVGTLIGVTIGALIHQTFI